MTVLFILGLVLGSLLFILAVLGIVQHPKKKDRMNGAPIVLVAITTFFATPASAVDYEIIGGIREECGNIEQPQWSDESCWWTDFSSDSLTVRVEDEGCGSAFLAKYSTILKYDFCDDDVPAGHNNDDLCGSFGGSGGYWAHWPTIDFGMASVRVRFMFEDFYLRFYKGGSGTECGWEQGQIGSLRMYAGQPWSGQTIVQLNWRNRNEPSELGRTIHKLSPLQSEQVAQLVYWWATAQTVDYQDAYHPSGRMIEIVLNSRGDLTGPNGRPFGFPVSVEYVDRSSAYLESATITRPFYLESEDPQDDSMWYVEAEIECRADVRYRWGSGPQFTGPREVWTNY